MSIKIAVMGAGSIGTIVGALIAKSGQDVVLIDIDEKNIAALNAQGARITGFLDLVVPVKAITPLQMSGTYDIVLLTTKQTYNEVALKQLLPHLTGNSTVCTLQNGRSTRRRSESLDFQPADIWWRRLALTLSAASTHP